MKREQGIRVSEDPVERMKQGILAGEFKMYLQAKIELSTMKITGAEALVRWDTPDEGLVYPDSFVPLFEQNGSIVYLDYYMLEQTCKYLREWLNQGKPALVISVNFSRVTMIDERFYETIVETVDRYGLPHSCVEIEVTESAFNEVQDSTLSIIESLKQAGFLISMDDFGAGYSNLNMLSRLPIQILKLDRGFMRTVDENKQARGIVACIVDMAHAMGLKVVCEGVEKEEHVRILRKMCCEYAQGYYFTRAIPHEKFEQYYQSFSIPEDLVGVPAPTTGFVPIENEDFISQRNILEDTMLGTYPGFISLRNEKHQIVYLNENFRNWIRQFTDVEPLGKTNIELAAVVPQNVADTFLECHDGSMELQKDVQNSTGLKKVIEFHGGDGPWGHTQYLDVLKYWVKLNEKPYILTIAYDVTGLYVENMRNFHYAMTDGLTGARNRRFMHSELGQYRGHLAVLINLDHFRKVNEEQGYVAGDHVLKEFVEFIQEKIPDVLVIIRLGDDEFLAIIEKGIEKEQILQQLQQLRKLYEKQHASYDNLSFSMGVDTVGDAPEDTLRRLSVLLSEDKKNIRNR